jgi:hypothetical protein
MTMVSQAIRRPVISVNFSIALSTIIRGFKRVKIPNYERLIVYRLNNKADTTLQFRLIKIVSQRIKVLDHGADINDEDSSRL